MLPPVSPTTVQIEDDEDIVAARQRGRQMAQSLGFGLVDQSRIATAISELARNIVRYARRGSLTLRPLARGQQTGLEMIFVDEGPGIADIVAAQREGFTTGGGLGIGLSGTRRLMDEMEIASEIGRGTRVVIRKWRH